MFFSWPDKIKGPFNAAYPLYLELLNGGPAAIKKALENEYFAFRKRLPPKDKPANIALMLAAKPREPKDEKTCSDYAPFLILAAMQKIRPDEFATRMLKYDLEDCAEVVRGKPSKKTKKAHKAASREAEPKLTEPALLIILTKYMETAVADLAKMPESA